MQVERTRLTEGPVGRARGHDSTDPRLHAHIALADFLPLLFSSNAEVVNMAALFLWIVPISYGAYGMVMVMNAAFNGLGQPMPAVGISVGRIIVLYLPLAIAGMVLFDAVGIFAAYAIANIISGIVAYQWAKKAVRERASQRTAVFE